MHIHITSPDGEAKFWLEPIVALAVNYGLSAEKLTELQKVVERKKNEIRKTWKKHFKS